MADTAAFDTLATARKLKAAGIDEAHAEAIAEAQAARAGRSELATKADIVGLEARFYRAMLWQCAFTVAVAAGAVGLMQALS